MQMLDADDAILEQAMQTGAALKRARDLQKAARKPKVITICSHLSGASYLYCILALMQLVALHHAINSKVVLLPQQTGCQAVKLQLSIYYMTPHMSILFLSSPVQLHVHVHAFHHQQQVISHRDSPGLGPPPPPPLPPLSPQTVKVAIKKYVAVHRWSTPQQPVM